MSTAKWQNIAGSKNFFRFMAISALYEKWAKQYFSQVIRIFFDQMPLFEVLSYSDLTNIQKVPQALSMYLSKWIETERNSKIIFVMGSKESLERMNG